MSVLPEYMTIMTRAIMQATNSWYRLGAVCQGSNAIFINIWNITKQNRNCVETYKFAVNTTWECKLAFFNRLLKKELNSQRFHGHEEDSEETSTEMQRQRHDANRVSLAKLIDKCMKNEKKLTECSLAKLHSNLEKTVF